MSLSLQQGHVLDSRFELRERLLIRTPSELWTVEDVLESSPRLLRVYESRAVTGDPISHAARLSAKSYSRQHDGLARVIDTRDDGALVLTVIDHRPGAILSTVPDSAPTPYRDVLRSIRPIAEALLAVHENGVEHGCVDADHVLVAGDGWVLLPPDVTATPRRDTRQLGTLMADRLTAGRETPDDGHLNDTPELLHAGRTIPAMLSELIHELRAGHVGSQPVLLRDVLDRFDQLERLTARSEFDAATAMAAPESDREQRSPRFIIEAGVGPGVSARVRRWPMIALVMACVAVIALVGVVGAVSLGSKRSEAPFYPAVPEAPTNTSEPPAGASPPSRSEQARPRADEALVDALEARADADAIGAASWASQEHATALAAAAEGDELYLDDHFAEAAERYEAAERMFREIVLESSRAYERLLAEGEAALASASAAEAIRAFENALLIAPESEAARIGAARAATIEEVRAHLRTGAAHERAGRLALALKEYSEALSIDPHALDAFDSRERVLRTISDREFRDAMAQGLTAYHSGEPGHAVEPITEAERLRPGADTAIAVALVREAALRRRLSELKETALGLERLDQWQSARNAYLQTLNLDPTIEFAQEGRRRAEMMIRLDVFSQEYIANPELLIQRGAREDSKLLLEEMQSVDSLGPRLREARQRLAELVRLANTPRPVVLHSDDRTEVEIYRVGQYRPLRSVRLELLPGEYTVVGHRDGYRDVRMTLRVAPGSEPLSIHVACTEPI